MIHHAEHSLSVDALWEEPGAQFKVVGKRFGVWAYLFVEDPIGATSIHQRGNGNNIDRYLAERRHSDIYMHRTAIAVQSYLRVHQDLPPDVAALQIQSLTAALLSPEDMKQVRIIKVDGKWGVYAGMYPDEDPVTEQELLANGVIVEGAYFIPQIVNPIVSE